MRTLFILLLATSLNSYAYANLNMSCTNGANIKIAYLGVIGYDAKSYTNPQATWGFEVNLGSTFAGHSRLMDSAVGDYSCIVTPEKSMTLKCNNMKYADVLSATFTPFQMAAGNSLYSVAVKTPSGLEKLENLIGNKGCTME